MSARRPECLDERFLAKVLVGGDDGCLMWTGAMNPDGYGQFWNGQKSMGAHRWAYERFVGEVPEDRVLDHFWCSNRACVNWLHLRPVSSRENALRGETIVAANLAKTHCPQGHEYQGENLYVRPSDGARMCRACLRGDHYNDVFR